MILKVCTKRAPKLIRRQQQFFACYHLVGLTVSETVERCLGTRRRMVAQRRFGALVGALTEPKAESAEEAGPRQRRPAARKL